VRRERERESTQHAAPAPAHKQNAEESGQSAPGGWLRGRYPRHPAGPDGQGAGLGGPIKGRGEEEKRREREPFGASSPFSVLTTTTKTTYRRAPGGPRGRRGGRRGGPF
jgi:hypothetical protein